MSDPESSRSRETSVGCSQSPLRGGVSLPEPMSSAGAPGRGRRGAGQGSRPVVVTLRLFPAGTPYHSEMGYTILRMRSMGIILACNTFTVDPRRIAASGPGWSVLMMDTSKKFHRKLTRMAIFAVVARRSTPMRCPTDGVISASGLPA
jgi:hypothetical protein